MTPSERLTSQRRIPLAALIPGLLGLVPFWFLAIASGHDIGLDPISALLGLLSYGALILSFVGALWWGIAAHAEADAQRNAMFLGSVIPALIGWFALMVTPDVGLILLASGLLLQWALDLMLYKKQPRLISVWMLRLRTILTIGACTALVFGWYELHHAIGSVAHH